MSSPCTVHGLNWPVSAALYLHFSSWDSSLSTASYAVLLSFTHPSEACGCLLLTTGDQGKDS